MIVKKLILSFQLLLFVLINADNSSISELNITNVIGNELSTSGQNMTFIYETKPLQFLLSSRPMLNITCNDERNSIIANKQGLANILKCCSQILMCQCFEDHCNNDPDYKNGIWCEQVRIHGCKVGPDCDGLNLDTKKCNALPEVGKWLFYLLIAIGVAIAFAILVLICMIGYKKFKAFKSNKKTGSQSHIRMAIASSPNVTSQVMCVDTANPSQYSQSRASSMSKAKDSGTSSKSGYNSRGSSRQSDRMSKLPQQQQTTNHGQKFSRDAIKPTRSFLQRAVL